MRNTKISLIFSFLLFAIIFISCKENEDLNSREEVNSLLNNLETIDPASEEYSAVCDSIIQLSIINGFIQERRIAEYKRGYYYFSKNDYGQTISILQNLINNSSAITDSINGNSYNLLGRTHYRLKNHNESIQNFKHAAGIRETIKDSTEYGVSLNNIGFVYWTRSEFDSAIVYFEKALLIREKLDNYEYTASTLNNLGTIYYQWALYDRALEHYLKALDYRRKINDQGTESLLLSNIGLVYQRTNNILNAKEYFYLAVEKARAVNDTQKISYALSNLGGVHLKENPDSSLYYFQKSFNLYNSVNYIGGKLIALEGMGKTFFQMDSLDKAEEYFQRINQDSKKEGLKIREIYALKYLGDVYHKRNQFNRAIEYFNSSNELAHTQKINEVLRDNYRNLSDLYEKTGLIEKALESTKAYLKYDDLIENEEIARKTTALQRQFELERLNRSIESSQYENDLQKTIILFTTILIIIFIVSTFVLYRSNKKRQKSYRLLSNTNKELDARQHELNNKNKELLELNKTRNKFYSIVAHDLKNPFITLYGYTEILKQEYYSLTDPEKIEYINELEKASKKTYKLLENLLELSSSKSGEIEFKPSTLNINDILTPALDVVSSQAKNKGIKIELAIYTEKEVIADRTMVDVILRNLITNAIKYSHTGKSIQISVTENTSFIIFCIKDFGVGIAAKKISSLFSLTGTISTRGTKDEKGTGLGLNICKEFVEKNKGKIWVESELGKGSEFYFSLPISKN